MLKYFIGNKIPIRILLVKNMIRLVGIQKRRKQVNLTQAELAKLAGVSQSVVAKIEAGSINPSYEIVTKIFSVLDDLEHKGSLKAVDIMASRVIFARPDEKIESAIMKMKKSSISQIPVIQRNIVVGLFSDAGLIDHLGEPNLSGRKVSDVMGDPPPLIPGSTPVKTVSELLKLNPIVLVSEKAKISGIISKTDLLKVVK